MEVGGRPGAHSVAFGEGHDREAKAKARAEDGSRISQADGGGQQGLVERSERHVDGWRSLQRVNVFLGVAGGTGREGEVLSSMGERREEREDGPQDASGRACGRMKMGGKGEA